MNQSTAYNFLHLMNDTKIYLELIKTLTYFAFSFVLSLWWAPSLIKVLNQFKFWKKKPRTLSTTGEELVVTKEFYEKNEKKRLIPRAGGLLISFTAVFFSLFFWVILKIAPENKTLQFLNIIDRRETFIPLATLYFGAVFGLIDDALSVAEGGGNYHAGGLKLRHRLALVTILSLGIGWWFWAKLAITKVQFFWFDIVFKDWNILGFALDWLIIPITVITLVGLWGTSVIDGIDGLAAGVFIPIYICFAYLSFGRGFYDIATFLMVIVGSMMSYLWFNLPPAKFTLGDTGSLCLVLTLGSVAILTGYLYLIPIACIMPIVTVGSNIIQVFSKKVLKRKVFLAAPIHHHFQAKGWSNTKIVTRYWIISLLFSSLALVLGLVFR
jgi:phospho-N-acetylmuramoyl-pentapeptide-transferase